MTRTLEPITVSIPECPHRMLLDALLPEETLDGLVTALLIGEVRYRRTDLHWQITSADEPLMSAEIAAYGYLVHHPNTTITTTQGCLMYTITAEVSSDVLTEYDATLDTWEDRSEELAALIHLEDEMRDMGASAIDRQSLVTEHPTTTIEVRLDSHDHAALERALGIGDDAGDLLTGLMRSTLSNLAKSPVQVVDPLRTSA